MSIEIKNELKLCSFLQTVLTFFKKEKYTYSKSAALLASFHPGAGSNTR